MAAMLGAPRVPAAFIARPRVWALFDAGESLIVVRAGAGAGKTIAAAGWVADRGERGVWLDAGAAFDSSAAFWADVIERLADAGLFGAQHPQVSTPSALADSPDLRATVVRALLRLSGEVVLVIDDAQLLDASTVDDLVAIVPRVPVRVLALCRPGGALDSERVLMSLAPVVVEADELAFTHDEVAAALRLAEDDPRVESVLAATGGTALLVRAATADPATPGRPPGTAAGSARGAGGAVSASVLSLRQSSAASALDPRFSLRVATADAVDEALARELSGRDDAAELLRAEAEAGLGTWSTGEAEPAFRYSPVILASLRGEAATALREELPSLHRAVAEHHLRSGRSFEALTHAVAAHDLALASRAAISDWFGLLRGHGRAVEALLAQVSRQALRRAPVLEMMLALYYNAQSTRRVRAIELFALAALDGRGHRVSDPAERVLLAVIESASMRVLGRDERTRAAAERADAALAELSPEAKSRLGSNLVPLLNHLAISYFAVGDLPRAMIRVEQALAEDDPGHYRGHSLALAAGFHAVVGDLGAARRFAAAAEAEPGGDGWHDGYLGALYRVARAILALEPGDLAGAQRELDVLQPHLDTIEHWAVIAYLQSVIDASSGRALQGLAALAAQRRRGARATLTDAQQEWVEAAHVLLLLAAGRPAEARSVVGRTSRGGILNALSHARIDLALGHPQRALDALRPYDTPDFALTRPRAGTEVLTLLVAANKRLGRDEVALDRVNRAIGIMRANGLRWPAALVPGWQGDRLIEWARERREVALAAQLEELHWPESVLLAVGALAPLTDRESAVLARLATGATRSEIARDLFVSENTVKTQLSALYRKLGVTTREGAVRAARERSLLR